MPRRARRMTIAASTLPKTTAVHHDDTHWNHAHLGALAGLPLYAAAAQAAGWSAFSTLAVHLALTLAWFAAFEHGWVYRPGWRPRAADLRRDGAFLGVNAAADGMAGVLVAAAAAAWVGQGPATTLPPWAGAVLAVLVAELGAYWLHRAMHAGGWGWRVHAVHHRPEALNVTNNLTVHPLNVISLKIVKMLPVVALGFEPQAILYASLFMQLQSFATHANTRGRMGLLNYVIGTAELHRWHHSVEAGEALNFATAIPLWDQLFGTFLYRPGQGPAAVGVQPASQYPDSADIWALLRYPFR
jgi:sterol desaturase/sphingolipid hydroxylase (fatty acid hydroxylase superfamily)